MIQGSYSPAFPLKHQQKDMRLALALGDENALSMPVAAAANEVIADLCLFFETKMLLPPKIFQTMNQIFHIVVSRVEDVQVIKRNICIAGLQEGKKHGFR